MTTALAVHHFKDESPLQQIHPQTTARTAPQAYAHQIHDSHLLDGHFVLEASTPRTPTVSFRVSVSPAI